jgi:hypothetical protein
VVSSRTDPADSQRVDSALFYQGRVSFACGGYVRIRLCDQFGYWIVSVGNAECEQIDRNGVGYTTAWSTTFVLLHEGPRLYPLEARPFRTVLRNGIMKPNFVPLQPDETFFPFISPHVNVRRDYELRYWSEKFGVTRDAVEP